MKNIIFLIFFLSSPFLLISQFHTSVDFIGSFDFSNKNSQTFGSSGNMNRIGYRIGGNFNFKVFNRKFFKTGIRYTRQGTRLLRNRNSYATTHDIFDEFYLEIPLLFRYEFDAKKYSPFFEIGTSHYIYLKGKYIQEISGVKTVEDFDHPYIKDRRFRLAINLAVGFNYQLSKNYQFFTQPTLRYFLPVTFDSTNSFKTINFGIEFGIRRALTFDIKQ